MKNFFKKLSFVLAIAMVLTSIAPATASAAEVVPAKKVKVKVDGEKVDTINLNVDETENIKLGLPVKKAFAGQKSTYKTWYEVDGTAVEVVRVGNKKYEVTGVEAGEATITFGAAETKKLAKAGEFKKTATLTVVVEDGFAMTDVTAKKVNKLEVAFNGPVDTEKVTLSVVKGNNAVDHKVEWNADKTVATITTTAKMTVGTYTVKATVDETTAEKSVDIENQRVDKIVIMNDVALTGKADVDSTKPGPEDAGEIYVYYKVLDQYEEDLTASTSIQWSTSCDSTPSVNRSEGKLTLNRSDAKAFTYGEQIYVTGVYTKTGVSVQATLTVGTEQSLHTVELKGFVKKNTTTILQSLPSGFKSGEYYLVFDAMDQNGNALKADAVYTKGSATTSKEVTFISDNYLIVSDVKNGDTTLVIDGHEYNAVLVEPGDFVSRGGEVNITAIATKTGNKSTMNYVVGQNQILASFTMSQPLVNVVSDGEEVEIPFVALDQNGEKITNFVTLADNLNRLTFSVSDGKVVLAQQNDATAKLVYQDTNAPGWDDSRTTDGIDRTVSITSVVVGGTSDNLMLSISDKARPDAIMNVDLKTVYLEGTNTVKIKLDTFTFLDQYGRKIDKNSKLSGYTVDNGFFVAASTGAISGNDFSGYAYDVVVEYKGNPNALVGGSINATTNAAVVGLQAGSFITFNTDAKTQTAMTGNNFVFAIAKVDKDDKANVKEYENVSNTVNHSFTVVDIKQVRNITVDDVKMLNVDTDASAYMTGSLFSGMINNATQAATSAKVMNPQAVTVKGTYNGVSVDVPAAYYTVYGQKVVASNSAVTLGDVLIDEVSAAGTLVWSDLYDFTTAQYLRKIANDTLKVNVYEVYSNGVDGQEEIGTPLTLGAANVTQAAILRDSVNKALQISDAKPTVTYLNVPAGWVVNPTLTDSTMMVELYVIELYANHYGVNLGTAHAYNIGACTILDQYGNEMYGIEDILDNDELVSFKISQIEEATGYADNNFTVSNNDSYYASISGAELGDTFVLTVTVNDGRNVISKDINVTVGADTEAKLTNYKNHYTNTNVGETDLRDILEVQRRATLN